MRLELQNSLLMTFVNVFEQSQVLIQLQANPPLRSEPIDGLNIFYHVSVLDALHSKPPLGVSNNDKIFGHNNFSLYTV